MVAFFHLQEKIDEAHYETSTVESISQTSKGNENWFVKSGVRNIRGKNTVKKIQGKRLCTEPLQTTSMTQNLDPPWSELL